MSNLRYLEAIFIMMDLIPKLKKTLIIYLTAGEKKQCFEWCYLKELLLTFLWRWPPHDPTRLCRLLRRQHRLLVYTFPFFVSIWTFLHRRGRDFSYGFKTSRVSSEGVSDCQVTCLCLSLSGAVGMAQQITPIQPARVLQWIGSIQWLVVLTI